MHTWITLAIAYIGEPLGMLLVRHPEESTAALGMIVAAMYAGIGIHFARLTLRGVR